ncbi:MAG: Permease [Burkholderia sp.]|jgi:hypothetical protein
MSMTHYMELLMQNSPWNLLIFMALPVVLAETIAITELVLLYSSKDRPGLRSLNRICGVLAGIVFIGIALYLIPGVVMPVTDAHEWRTWVDELAVGAYLLAGVPMVLIALLHLKVILRSATEHVRKGFHIACVAAFLILSHVAMIAGMVDPAVTGWKGAAMGGMQMHEGMAMDHGSMDRMDHGSMPMNHDGINHAMPSAHGGMQH